ncbi:Metallo-dependent phosphatase-like protein [Mycotypha africana]|uniref:Metallo-dependent phosphatase-like protein n=1 Tax=Mycotypha africana TaxID=64632 RepID=UPI002301E1B6|nr:Metallo-dependent phosphatase-like protein [Mycotypha africana]KAI8991070.1 Metallo-dependent phosphatase-like protein [Mycotypha africana]
MVFLKSLTYSALSLLIALNAIQAKPTTKARALVKRSSKLHGKFLHITDIHFDPHYKAGSDPDSYCHKHSSKRGEKAGTFGALGSDCDTPAALLDATFSFLKNEIDDIDFIIYTGDSVRHNRDDEMKKSDDEIVDIHKSVLKYFQSAYDTKKVPFIPTIGNNDGFNHNDFVKKDSIYGKLASVWSGLNLNLDTNFKVGGYFAQELIKNKLSVINLNSMYFFHKNDEVDDCDSSSSPGAIQLRWFERMLKQYSKKKGHSVYVMGHIPPADDEGEKLYKDACYSKYINLLGKYGNTIVGHFTGHTNNDNLLAVVPEGKSSSSYTVVRADGDDLDDDFLKKASVGLFSAPSIIPANNPAFRVYNYDTSGKQFNVGTILDWDQYYVDLEKANDKGKVQFEIEYSASDLYHTDHFNGDGVGEAFMSLCDDDDARDLYSEFVDVKGAHS